MSQLPIAYLYVQRKSVKTNRIAQHLAVSIPAGLNRFMELKKIYVTQENVADLRKHHRLVTTPSVLFRGRMVSELSNILQVLTPPNAMRAGFGAAMSPEEQTQAYIQSFADKNISMDEHDGDETVLTNEILQRRMDEIQRRRPQFDGLTGNNADKLNRKTGRKIVARNAAPAPTFETDDDFVRSTGDNVGTPYSEGYDEGDGSTAFEDYKLAEAQNTAGYKPMIRPRRKAL